jgi:hypothetical protein
MRQVVGTVTYVEGNQCPLNQFPRCGICTGGDDDGVKHKTFRGVFPTLMGTELFTGGAEGKANIDTGFSGAVVVFLICGGNVSAVELDNPLVSLIVLISVLWN